MNITILPIVTDFGANTNFVYKNPAAFWMISDRRNVPLERSLPNINSDTRRGDEASPTVFAEVMNAFNHVSLALWRCPSKKRWQMRELLKKIAADYALRWPVLTFGKKSRGESQCWTRRSEARSSFKRYTYMYRYVAMMEFPSFSHLWSDIISRSFCWQQSSALEKQIKE